MRRSEKNGQRAEQARKSTKKTAKVEPLRPQAEQIGRIPDDLEKFPEENPHPVLRIHKDGTVLYANKAGKAILKAMGSAVALPAPKQWCRLEEKVIASGKMVREEVENSKHIFEFCAVPVDNTDYVNFYGNDITECKKAEKDLRDSEKRFRSLFEQAVDAIVVVDARTGKFVEFNDKACEMLGYTRAEYVNLSLTDIEAVESKKEEITAHIEKIVRQGSDIFETKHRKKDGTICDVLVSVKLISVAGKQYIQGVWRDITMLKKDQRELLEDRMQLKQLTSQLALTEERQRRKIASELHDLLSQSLALAKVKLDIIRATAQGQLQTELTDVADTLQSLIDQTRTLVFDISSPILYELGFEAAVAEWLNEQIRIKHGIYAEFQDDGRPKPLDDDVKVLLFRNVRELLINIIKYAHADKVNVSIRRTNDSIEITVMDNGVGFDTGQVKAMVAKFEKFGLFGIRESVEQLGGRFDIESKPGAGCTATIVAPLKRKE